MTFRSRNLCRRIATPFVLLTGLLLPVLSVNAQAPDPPVFSIERGLYHEPIQVTLSATPDASIRYTLDGSPPGAENGTLYQEALQIEATTVLRAVTILAGERSPIATHSYLFPATLAQQQAPSSYPARWSDTPADYGIDDEVMASEGKEVEMAIYSLPSASIVTDQANLFDANGGIYTNPQERGRDWERPTSFELLFPGGDAIQVDAGVRIHGGASRDPHRSPKHSLRIYFRSDYGPSKLEYPVFGPDGVVRFDKLLLRAGYNNTWIHADLIHQGVAETQRLHAQYLRDQIVRDVQRDMGQPYIRGRYVHVWLNGLYWGLFNLVERPDSDFAADLLGGDKDEWDVIGALEVQDGNIDAYWRMRQIAERGVADPADYASLLELLDVENFADYMILNHYIGAHDWDESNWYAMRRRVDGDKFRFFSWDAEHSLEDLTDDRAFDYDHPFQPTRIFQRMRTNREFVVLFGDRIRRHLLGNGPLTPEHLRGLWQQRAAQIDQAVTAESARWGDYRRDVKPSNGKLELYRRDPHWLAEKTRMLEQYLPYRRDIVLDEYRSRGLYPDLDAPELSHYGGPAPEGLSVAITNPNASGVLYFSTLEDPRLEGGELSSLASVYSAPIVLAPGAQTLYSRVLAEGVWSALTKATFQVGIAGDPCSVPLPAIVITEISYNAPDANDPEDWIEILNAQDTPVDLSGWFYRDEANEYVLPAMTILAPGELVVLAQNLATFAPAYPAVANVIGSTGFGLSGGGERIEISTADDCVVDEVDYDDALPWPLEADGEGPTLVLLNSAADNSLGESWFRSGADGGSPGELNLESFVDGFESGSTSRWTP